MLQLAVPLQLSVTADHQENSPQLSNAKVFKSEMQVKDFKRTNTNVTKSKQVNSHKNFS
jgi:hypothetical protein